MSSRDDLATSAADYGWGVINTPRRGCDVYRRPPYSVIVEFRDHDSSIIKAMLFADPPGMAYRHLPPRRMASLASGERGKRAKVRHWLYEYSST